MSRNDDLLLLTALQSRITELEAELSKSREREIESNRIIEYVVKGYTGSTEKDAQIYYRKYIKPLDTPTPPTGGKD